MAASELRGSSRQLFRRRTLHQENGWENDDEDQGNYQKRGVVGAQGGVNGAGKLRMAERGF